VWSYTSTPSYVCTVWCLIKQQRQLYHTFYLCAVVVRWLVVVVRMVNYFLLIKDDLMRILPHTVFPFYIGIIRAL
jgi:hypothetical protein